MTKNSFPEKTDSPFPLSESSAEIIEILRLNGRLARSDVAAFTNLSQQTVHRLTSHLTERKLLTLDKPQIDGRGKPSPILSLNGEGAYAVGIDVNTSIVQLSHVDFKGNILAKMIVDVDPNKPQQVVEKTFIADQQQRKILGLEPSRFGGLGVSMPGFRRSRGGSFLTPLLVDKWSDIPVKDMFVKKFGQHVFVENNGTLGSIAEAWVGAGHDYETFAYLSFNYGLGGGLILNGKPYYGANGNAAELSAMYMPHEMDDRPAMAGLLAELRANGIDIKTLNELVENFDPNWPGVEGWIARVSPALNMLIRALTAILDPAAIIFGGEAPLELRELLIKACMPRAPDRHGRPIPEPKLVASKIIGDPSLQGAAINALRCRILGFS